MNEIEATAKRATRGAGYSWGQAEEASKATRWLCSQGLDGTAALSHLLNLGLAANPASHRPRQVQGRLWQGESELCPLFVGPLLSDSVHLLKTGLIEARGVVVPALLLPFVSNAACMLNDVLTVEIDGARVVIDANYHATRDGLPTVAKMVTVSLGGAISAPCEQHTRARPNQDDWDALNRLAHRTYAPATEESRLLGAGAGISDHD